MDQTVFRKVFLLLLDDKLALWHSWSDIDFMMNKIIFQPKIFYLLPDFLQESRGWCSVNGTVFIC
jgi:hypothetical protein